MSDDATVSIEEGIVLSVRNWEDLIIGSNFDCKKICNNRSIMTVSPLARGMGATLGNALRRALHLLRGTAITSMQTDSVNHEFQSIPGVREDVLDIAAAIKSVVVSILSGERAVMTLDVEGPCNVTAGMIVSDSAQVLNGDEYLFFIDDGYKVKINFEVTYGIGYVSSAVLIKPEDPIGLIRLDAIFSPIRFVSYKVLPARVGQSTDYDKLIIDIETDGTISADVAVATAARILQEQLSSFVTYPDEKVQERQSKSHTVDQRLFRKVSDLDLSVRVLNCFTNSNVVYVADLVQMTISKILKIPNFGKKSLNEVKNVIHGMGLTFGMKIENWPPVDEELDSDNDGSGFTNS